MASRWRFKCHDRAKVGASGAMNGVVFAFVELVSGSFWVCFDELGVDGDGYVLKEYIYYFF